MAKEEHDYSVNADKYGGYNGDIVEMTPSGSLVLDLGCSTGRLAKELRAKGCKVLGTDIDPNSLKKARDYCSQVFLADLDHPEEAFEKILAKKSLDVITMGDLLEHIKYPKTLLLQLFPYLKEGGQLIASIPNAAFALNRLKFLFGDFSYSENGGLMDADHLRFFTFKTVCRLFEESGFKIERIYGISEVKSHFWFLRPLAKLMPTLFAIHIMIKAKR